MLKKLGWAGVLVTIACGVWVGWGVELLRALESDEPSRSEGTPSRGELIHGKRLPVRGPNFEAYSYLGALIGRTCVHERVRDVVTDAYARSAESAPGVRFMYGETAWCSGGGRMPPHHTHQNGWSVDFMVPVEDEAGASASYPAWPWTKFGYGVEFDERGRRGRLRIDFDALAAHLLALEEAARAREARLKRVILAPELRPELFAARRGAQVRRRIRFMPRRAWIRHDEHYHVDFAP